MSEWWTYRLSNFLLFSPRTYDRLFELYNDAIWPAQIPALLLGLFLLDRLSRPTDVARRLATGLLAACWIWVAIAFHAKRYATINFAAVQFAWAFVIEAALLLWFGVLRDRLTIPRPSRAIPFSPRAPGFWFLAYALFLHPFAALLSGRNWKGLEVFGVAPDPTAIATIGAVLAVAKGRRWPMLVIPILWCVVSGLTLRAMKAPDGWLILAVAAAAVVFSVHRRTTSSARAPRGG